MIIVKVMGGLGNQLQQFAVYKKFEELGVQAALDVSWFEERSQEKQLKKRELELDYFDGLSYRKCTAGERQELLGKNTFFSKLAGRVSGRRKYFPENGRMYLPEIFKLRDAYLEGYFACEMYYHELMPLLRRCIRFPEPGERNRELAGRMAEETSASLHIRRGDYLDQNNAALFGGICTEEYYDAAVGFLKERFPGVRFYVFSDDTEYAKLRYEGEEFTVVDWNMGKDSFFDMYLMSRCKHNICANSTFSFWGARLNPYPDKTMIRPLKHRNNQEYDEALMKELWEGWTLFDGRRRI